VTVLSICGRLYGIAGSFSSLLQAAALVRAGSAREISIPFIAILTGGHAIGRLSRRHFLREAIHDAA
jgi:hypothetical protein